MAAVLFACPAPTQLTSRSRRPNSVRRSHPAVPKRAAAGRFQAAAGPATMSAREAAAALAAARASLAYAAIFIPASTAYRCGCCPWCSCLAELIDGKAIADQIRQELKAEVAELKQRFGKASTLGGVRVCTGLCVCTGLGVCTGLCALASQPDPPGAEG